MVIKRRVLMVQPSINPPGGGNAVACWMLEALRDDYDVTLLTRVTPDLGRVNRACGTRLSSSDLRVVLAPADAGPLLAVARPVAALALLRDHLLLGRARRMGTDFDLLVTAHNESDLGHPGIQYVHFPKLVADRPDAGRRWYQGRAAVVLYQAVCAIATGFNTARMRANTTLVNSEWTGQLVSARHGIRPVTLPPPVAGEFPDVPWGERRFAFACVGRIAREKRIEAIIDIVAEVRTTFPGLTLHIAGNADDRTYLARVEAAVRSQGEWVTLDLDLPRDRLIALITGCRFGIHGMHDEHFGMAVAELVRGGTVTFAHNSGGPIEILGGDRRLLFESDADAVKRIRDVLADDALASTLHTSLTANADRFSSAHFVREFRHIVASRLRQTDNGPRDA